jgi:hypothetical protein
LQDIILRKPKYLEKVTDKTNYDRTWWYLRMYRQSKCFSYSEIWKQMQSKWLYWLYYVLMFDIFLCRVKSFEFTKQGLTFEIPRLLTLSDCAYRVLDPKYLSNYLPLNNPIIGNWSYFISNYLPWSSLTFLLLLSRIETFTCRRVMVIFWIQNSVGTVW